MKNKRKKIFKNKVQMISYMIIFVVCIALFIIIGKMDFTVNKESEANKFSAIYKNISSNNIYVFANATDVLNILNGRTGVILMGFPSNKWTEYYASILNDAAMEVGIEHINYYDFLSDRDESNGTYETIVKKLKVYAPVDDEGTQDIMAPTVIVVKNGDIIGYFDETAIIKGVVTPELYYTENQKASTYLMFKNALIEFMK